LAISELAWRRILREELSAFVGVPIVVPPLPPDVIPVAPPKMLLVKVTSKLADVQIDVSPPMFPITVAAVPVDAQTETDVSISVSVETRVE
jgi:hypothetical protein